MKSYTLGLIAGVLFISILGIYIYESSKLNFYEFDCNKGNNNFYEYGKIISKENNINFIRYGVLAKIMRIEDKDNKVIIKVKYKNKLGLLVPLKFFLNDDGSGNYYFHNLEKKECRRIGPYERVEVKQNKNSLIGKETVIYFDYDNNKENDKTLNNNWLKLVLKSRYLGWIKNYLFNFIPVSNEMVI